MTTNTNQFLKDAQKNLKSSTKVFNSQISNWNKRYGSETGVEVVAFPVIHAVKVLGHLGMLLKGIVDMAVDLNEGHSLDKVGSQYYAAAQNELMAAGYEIMNCIASIVTLITRGAKTLTTHADLNDKLEQSEQAKGLFDGTKANISLFLKAAKETVHDCSVFKKGFVEIDKDIESNTYDFQCHLRPFT